MLEIIAGLAKVIAALIFTAVFIAIVKQAKYEQDRKRWVRSISDNKRYKV